MFTTRIAPRSFRLRSLSATTFSCSGPRTPRTTNCRGPNGIVTPPLACVSIRTCPLGRNTYRCGCQAPLSADAGCEHQPASVLCPRPNEQPCCWPLAPGQDAPPPNCIALRVTCAAGGVAQDTQQEAQRAGGPVRCAATHGTRHVLH